MIATRRSANFAGCLIFLTLVLYILCRRQGVFSPSTHNELYTGVETVTTPEPEEPKALSQAEVTAYVASILDPKDRHLPRLQCPSPDPRRYKHLKNRRTRKPPVQYHFALNLRQCLKLLPQLLGSVVEAIRFLGPEQCALSIIEGNSEDGTPEVLAVLQRELEKLMGDRVRIVLGDNIDPVSLGSPGGARFSRLAELRNMALQPLVQHAERYAADATVVFINDVAICTEDILELMHQRHALRADMTCAMDWVVGDDGRSLFYDSYIARSANGDLFFDIPPETGSFGHGVDGLFWNEPVARARLEAHLPFQVFSCWNGAVSFAARPILERKLTFRAAREDLGECYGGEPQLFCKDMAFQGYGKIAVVPSVNLEYSVGKGETLKKLKGYVSSLVGDDSTKENITWQPPPDQVKCMPTFNNQYWRPWNDTLS
ncbi:alpha-1-3-mannosyltransferase CMT1 [Apiospora rasikravindrae]|uniref:Alpha-1-3-mannosyltransferase CMT1 n=1 Tax=Apiospora rasikravindrae TaxID=990691 RepID=A0ABR1UAR9_9PEZI